MKMSLSSSAALRAVNILILGFYVFFWSIIGTLPFLDFPNHLARCSVISKLVSEPASHFHQFFSFSFAFTPYFLGDLLLASLILCTSVQFAAVVWPVVCFLSLPLALTFYLRQLRVEREQIILAQLFSLYLSSNWFFLMGFFNFQLGVSLVFVALGLWERVMANLGVPQSEAADGHFRYFNYGLFVLAVTSAYLMHLAALFFLGVILVANAGFRMWRRERFVTSALLSLMPLVLLGGIHLLKTTGALSGFGSETGVVTFRSAGWKLTSMGMMFLRFDKTIDIILFIVFIILVIGPVLTNGIGSFQVVRETRTKQHLLFILVLVLLYAVLPVAVSGLGSYDSLYIDSRALPFIFVFIVCVGLRASATLVEGRRGQESPCVNSKGICLRKVYLASTVLLALANLGYLVAFLTPYEGRLKEYKQAILAIPENKVVLPVATWKAESRIDVGQHFGALYTAMRGGIIPYLFSGDRNFPPTYFRYRQRLYAPNFFWYRGKVGVVDWSQVQSTYDYIIATKPFDMGQVDIPKMVEIFSNNSTSVYALRKRSQGG
jgi:hypothetical protein